MCQFLKLWQLAKTDTLGVLPLIGEISRQPPTSWDSWINLREENQYFEKEKVTWGVILGTLPRGACVTLKRYTIQENVLPVAKKIREALNEKWDHASKMFQSKKVCKGQIINMDKNKIVILWIRYWIHS